MFGRFRLVAEVGRGGMGVVWRALDTKLARDVALKFLPEAVVRDREAMADLAAETRRCLELTHPHIVRVHDLVEEGGRAAISMELVDGPSLAERKLAQPQRCFDAAEIAEWVRQLGEALGYAHAKVGIVHRDLKPLNLLVNGAGELKVVDFGIARHVRPGRATQAAEHRGATMSLGYASPEQVLGAAPAVTDDVYALGATIYELLTGKPPFFEGDIVAQLRAVVPPPMAVRRRELGVSGRAPIPAEWEATVAACLAKRAGARPATAADVLSRLGLAGEGATRSRAAGRPSTGGPRSQVRALVLTAVAVALTGWYFQRQRVEEAAVAAAAAEAAAVRISAKPAPAPELRIEVRPADAGARVWVGRAAERTVPDDGTLGWAGLADGEHALTVSASGYRTHQGTVQVAGGRGAATVVLQPVHGSVEVTARPGTTVTTLDARGRERAVGTVGADGVLRASDIVTTGTYVFVLRHPEAAEARQAGVTVSAGRTARVTAPQPAPSAELRVFSLPDGAEVRVDGVRRGTTPLTLSDLPSGRKMAVEVARPGFRRVTRDFTLAPRQTESFDAGTLVAASASLDLQIGDPRFGWGAATVRIDGTRVEVRQGRVAAVEAGDREITVEHPNYEPWKEKMTVPESGLKKVAVKPVPRPGRVTVTVRGPEAATLVLDGKPVKPVRDVLTVAAGEHTLTVTAPGWRTERRPLPVPPNGRLKLEIALERVAQPQTGAAWTVPEIGLVLMPVAPGKFRMGRADGDPTERPETEVTLTKPFWLGRTEVSQREWRTLMEHDHSRFRGDELPVENVTWTEAMEFCRRLTEREKAADRLPAGYVYTLPTEAQWDYASRAGEAGTAEHLAAGAWHEGNSGDRTHPVGARAANAWGLHDLHGNVGEWCLDYYRARLNGGAQTDPTGPERGTTRVRRGGSYKLKAQYFPALRGTGAPELREFTLGFRVALAAER
jgi:formylglycine-generating enzyme required for sulfatase activity